MADKLRGEVVLHREGGDLTLVYNDAALCQMEDRLDMGVAAIGERLSKDVRLSFLRAVFHAGLRTYHRDISEDQAGDLILELGDQVGPAITEAMTAAFPQAEKGDATSAPRPPKAAKAAGENTLPAGVN
jgi:hypothetical protein